MATKKLSKKAERQRLRRRAKAVRQFAPNARNWDLRKPLTPHQKGWLTRYENEMRGKGNLVALSNKEYNRLPKAARLAGGVKATALNVADPGDRVRIDKDGIIKVRTSLGLWKFIPVIPEPDNLVEETENEFDKGARQIFVWNTRGRSGEGSRDLENFTQQIFAWFQQYLNIDEWILGIVALYA